MTLNHVTELVQWGPHEAPTSATAPTTSPEGSSGPLSFVSTAPDLKARPSASDCVTCHTPAAREAGEVGVGILSTCSVGWALRLPRLGKSIRMSDGQQQCQVPTVGNI